MLTTILNKIAMGFNRTACALENRADHIDKLDTLKAENKELKAENKELKAENKELKGNLDLENPDLSPADGYETDPEEYCLGSYHRTWLQTLTERVDALEKKLDRLQGHIVGQDHPTALAERAADDRAELNDAIDEDDDEYIDPVERIMSMEPVGQFPPAKGE